MWEFWFDAIVTILNAGLIELYREGNVQVHFRLLFLTLYFDWYVSILNGSDLLWKTFALFFIWESNCERSNWIERTHWTVNGMHRIYREKRNLVDDKTFIFVQVNTRICEKGTHWMKTVLCANMNGNRIWTLSVYSIELKFAV